MIYTIGITGLFVIRFTIDDAPKAVHRLMDEKVHGVRSVKQRGCMVWATLDDAIRGAAFYNEKAMREHNKTTLSFHQTWIVVGVEAQWGRDTEPQTFAPQFPTAHELVNPAGLVELQQQMPI